MAVANENGELTRYGIGVSSTKFNCFIPTSASNDATRKIATVFSVEYPNGLRRGLSSNSKSERLGYGGYQQYKALTNSNMIYFGSEDSEYHVNDRTYSYGDFLPCYNVACLIQTQETELKFNDDHLKTEENRYEYTSIQNSQIQTLDDFCAYTDTKSKYLTKQTTYTYNDCVLSATIKNLYYNFGSTTSGMSENYAYTYDEKGNVLTETKPNGQVITYTYDSTYSIPLTQSYNQSAGKTILMENTLTSDGKNIAQSTTKESGVLKAKSTYSYSGTGNLTSQKEYLDETNYTEKQYVYGNNAQITETRAIGVKNLAGSLIAGTTGYTAGTLVTKLPTALADGLFPRPTPWETSLRLPMTAEGEL